MTFKLSTIREIFGIDLRTLALFRIALATMVIVDLILRSRDLTAHYSDRGILPRAALIGEFGQWLPSIHLLSGSARVQGALFVLAGMFALSLLVGYRTWLVTIVSWALLLSLQARNPVIYHGADLLLRLLLFWAMFLPLGARFSIDAALDRRVQEQPNNYFSMATLALLVQCMSVYLFGALLKTGSVWIPDGTAIYFALHLDYLVTPFGDWLGQFPRVLQGLTYFVWGLELSAPLLMFSPVFRLPLRLLAMALLIAMHLGFFLFLRIGPFPFVSITSLLAFTPGWVWDRLESRARTAERRGIVIYYDEPCEFCRKVCLILRTFLLLPETPIRPAQDDPAIYREMQAHNSWVVVDHDGSRHVRWGAVALVFKRSWIFWPLGLVLDGPFMRKLGDRIYETVARNRGKLAEWSAVALPYRERSIQPSWVANLVVAGLMVLVILINLRTLPWLHDRLPRFAQGIETTLRLDQQWNTFAPAPSRADGWFVVRGETANGLPVDVLHDRTGEPDWIRPEHLASEYATYRWRRYLVRLPFEQDAKYRPYYAQYLCRTWNEKRPRDQQIARLTIYFNYELVPADYMPRDTRRMLVYASACPGSEAGKESTPNAGAEGF
jgi:predicted DCC family thiol-disulfide oxidoreductase YuxK